MDIWLLSYSFKCIYHTPCFVQILITVIMATFDGPSNTNSRLIYNKMFKKFTGLSSLMSNHALSSMSHIWDCLNI